MISGLRIVGLLDHTLATMTTTLFTDGRPGDRSSALQKQLRQFLKSAPAGSVAHFSVMNFDGWKIADEMINAIHGGLHLYVNVSPDQKYRKTCLDFKRRFDAAVAHSGITGSFELLPRSKPKDHTKFFLFSSSGSDQWICAISSQNLTSRDAGKQQHTVIVSDRDLHKGLVTFWGRIRSRHARPNESIDGTRQKVVLFPRTADYVVGILDNLSPDPAKAVQGLIRVAMARWSGRGALIDKLIDRRKKGYTVRVLARNAGDEGVPKAVVDKLDTAGIEVCWLDARRLNLHSKYVLLEGYYGDGARKTWQRLVWSGSHNFTNAALESNHEMLLKSRDGGVVDAFSKNFDSLWKEAGGSPARGGVLNSTFGVPVTSRRSSG